ncbi:MAG: TIGR01777 family oxidoreductase [Anaerolineae bacterium]|nr:TIGR01777 family oxidoreductase [Anaerolineae bacterium]
MRVIITGGTGLIGRALVNSLAKEGHEIIVLSRNQNKTSGLPTGVRVVEWDSYSAKGWGELADGAGAIVNLGAENIAGVGFPPKPWTAARRKRILESRLNGGHAVVEAVRAAANKPGVVIQASAVGYYGPRGAEDVTEDTPPADDFLANVCKAWEASTAEVEQMGVRRCVMRSGGIFSTQGGMLPYLALPFRMFVGGKIGSGDQQVSWIHIDDEVAAIKYLINTPTASGVYNVTAPAQLTNAQMAKVLGRVLKRPSGFPTPAFPIKLAFGELGEKLILTGQRAVPKRLQESGFSFHYPEAEGALKDLFQNKE